MPRNDRQVRRCADADLFWERVLIAQMPRHHCKSPLTQPDSLTLIQTLLLLEGESREAEQCVCQLQNRGGHQHVLAGPPLKELSHDPTVKCVLGEVQPCSRRRTEEAGDY